MCGNTLRIGMRVAWRPDRRVYPEERNVVPSPVAEFGVIDAIYADGSVDVAVQGHRYSPHRADACREVELVDPRYLIEPQYK